jgi:hypothetical protein
MAVISVLQAVVLAVVSVTLVQAMGWRSASASRPAVRR